MKNLIFGASGYLGNHLYNFLSQKEKKVYGTYFRNKKKGLIYFDISKMKINSLKFIDSIDYAVIMSAVNSNVNDTNKNLNKTLKINLNKTKKLLEDCLKYGLTPVYISSDGVFDGKKGNYKENDVLNSLNHYGKIKKEIEKFITKKFNNYLIIRVSKVFSLQKNVLRLGPHRFRISIRSFFIAIGPISIILDVFEKLLIYTLVKLSS